MTVQILFDLLNILQQYLFVNPLTYEIQIVFLMFCSIYLSTFLYKYDSWHNNHYFPLSWLSKMNYTLILLLIKSELIVPNILSWQMNATIYWVSQKGTILHQAPLITIFYSPCI